MKKITFFILGLLLLYGCAGAIETVANPAEEDEISPNPFYLLPTEQRIPVPSGETVTVNFEIPSGFLDENAIKKFKEMDRLIAFVQADGYIENTEKDNYYSFGGSVEYKTY